MNEIKDILRQLPNTSHGQALRAYLDERMKELNDISRLTGHEDMLEKKGMVKMAKELLGFYVDKPPIDRKGNQYV